MIEHPHVLVLGSPRSGTSILGELFEVLPQFNYYFEPSVDWLNRTPWDILRWAMKNPIDLCEGNRNRAVQKRTPGLGCDMREVIDAARNLTAVWIVRHPLDAIASSLPGLRDGWMHGPEPVEWEALLYTPAHIRAAFMWRWINREGWASANELFKVELVRYEDLVLDTRATVERILWHVGGVDVSDPAVDRYVSLVDDATGGYEAKHQDRWVTQGHTRHVGRWRETLTPGQVAEVTPIVGEVASSFGYEELT